MARPLSAAAWIERFHAKGATYRQIAEGLNRSVSTVYAIRKGRNSGETVRPAAKQLAQRRAPDPRAHVVPVPKAPAPAPTSKIHGPPIPKPERYRLPSGERAAVVSINPTSSREILRAAGQQTSRNVQLWVTFGNGKQIRVLSHPTNPNWLRQQLRANPDFLLDYLAGIGDRYKERDMERLGGIVNVQVVETTARVGPAFPT